jgi:hypothetical protein
MTMKIKVGDCFRYDDAPGWGTAIVVAEHGDDAVLLKWSGIDDNRRKFIWLNSSVADLTPVSKLEALLLGLDTENEALYNGEKGQT